MSLDINQGTAASSGHQQRNDMTEPIRDCPQPDPPELVMRADGYHYQSEDEMKDLTDEQIWEAYFKVEVGSAIRCFRSIIAADRALNAPADRVGQDEAQSYQDADGCPTEKAVLQRFWRKHQSTGTPVAWLLTDENINHIQVDSVQRLIDRARLAHFTDLIIRINGKDEHYEADWLKHLVCATPPLNAPADRGVMREAVTEEMARAYLTANTRYWRENDKWRNGTALEAARVSLEAALAAAPTPPEQQEPAPDVLATLRAKVEGLHNTNNTIEYSDHTWCCVADVLALIDKMGGKV